MNKRETAFWFSLKSVYISYFIYIVSMCTSKTFKHLVIQCEKNSVELEDLRKCSVFVLNLKNLDGIFSTCTLRHIK